ncbi:hypothetical protein Tco_1323943 [Tanacetum coccineum]
MQESAKKLKVHNDTEEAKLKDCLEIIPYEEEITIDDVPLVVKSPSIVDWKVVKDGKKSYYQIIRADRSSKMYLFFNKMLRSFDKEDLETLDKLVKARYKSTRLVEEDRVLWGDLMTMFEPNAANDMWRNQQEYKLLSWKMYDSCGVHCLMTNSMHIYMLVEKKYPLALITLSKCGKRSYKLIIYVKWLISFLDLSSHNLRNLLKWDQQALLKDLSLYDNESWNDPRDFAKPVNAITLPQDVPSTSDRHLIELENQVQHLMEAHLAPKKPIQVNKITSSCDICSGPHDTQYCMEIPEQAFIDYASWRTDKAGGKWYTFKPEQNNLGDTYNPSWKIYPNLSLIPNRSFNNNPQPFYNQSNLEGLVSNIMASQDARLSKFEADFKQQQSKMTNKIDTVLKAITDRITGELPSDMVKNPKLNVNSTSPVLSARSYPTGDPQCSSHPPNLINAVKTYSKETNHSQKAQL